VDGDERFMRIALEEARAAGRSGEVPIGAVVTLDGKVVGRGRNAPIGSMDPTAHAEIAALRDAARTVDNYRLTGAELFCTVEPCLMCAGAAILARIGRLVWAAPDPKIGAVGWLEAMRASGAVLNHRFDVRSGVLADESAGLLRAFFRERRGSDDRGSAGPGDRNVADRGVER
jgi:tRNA(adenine34) deaminase